MIYSNEFGTVNFFDEYPELYSKKNIGINLSGGVDSAFLLFILCKKIKTNNLNIKIIPITGVDYERPLNIFHARTIVKLFEKKFKMNNVFEKHEEFWYRKDNEKDKSRHHQEHEIKLFNDKRIDLILHGRTSNPPYDIALSNNLVNKRELTRDIDVKKEVFNDKKTWYAPFLNVDKRFIAKEYEKHDLMGDLFPITASCISKFHETNIFKEPCKKCWWCREKKRAFNLYDGSTK